MDIMMELYEKIVDFLEEEKLITPDEATKILSSIKEGSFS